MQSQSDEVLDELDADQPPEPAAAITRRLRGRLSHDRHGPHAAT